MIHAPEASKPAAFLSFKLPAILAVAYLALPNFIFTIYWLKWQIQIAAVIAAALIFWQLIGYLRKTDSCQAERLSAPQIAWSFFYALVFSLLCGAGGIGFGNRDYPKHNSLLHDLVFYEWPLYYEVSGSIKALAYYVGYYLPPALFGTVFGSLAAAYAMAIWTFIGLFLVFVLLQQVTGRKAQLLSPLFILFGNLDLIGALLFKSMKLSPGTHLEFWADYVQYSSNATLLFWVPQHSLSGWLATLLVMLGMKSKTNPLFAVYLVPIILLWSPFIAIGIVPFVLHWLWRERNLPNIKDFRLWVAGAYSLLILIFLAANDGKFPSGFLHGLNGIERGAQKFVTFYILEVLLWPLVILLLGKGSVSLNKTPVLISLIWLSLLPLYRIGYYHDLAMRASIPAFVVLFVQLTLLSNNLSTMRNVMLGTLFTITSYSSLNELYRAVKNFTVQPQAVQFSRRLTRLPYNTAVTYLSSRDSFAAKWLIKAPTKPIGRKTPILPRRSKYKLGATK